MIAKYKVHPARSVNANRRVRKGKFGESQWMEDAKEFKQEKGTSALLPISSISSTKQKTTTTTKRKITKEPIARLIRQRGLLLCTGELVPAAAIMIEDTMTTRDKVYAVCVDSRRCQSSSQIAAYKEHTCTYDFFEENMLDNTKVCG